MLPSLTTVLKMVDLGLLTVIWFHQASNFVRLYANINLVMP
jgi:hypothetical protein